MGARWGRVVIVLKFDNVMPFASDRRTTYRDGPYDTGKFGYIDRQGNITIPAQFTYAAPFEGDTAEVTLYGGRITIDRTGQRIAACANALFVQVQDRRYRLMNPDLTRFNDKVYEYAAVSCGQPTLVQTDKRTSFLQADGTVLGGATYPKAGTFYDGVAPVWADEGTFAILDTQGRTIVGPLIPKADISLNVAYTVQPRAGLYYPDPVRGRPTGP
jgi:hypothetical protein